MNLLGNTVNFISSKMSNGSMDADLVQSVGTSLFSGIGNVLSAASSEAETDGEESGEDEEAQLEEDQADSEAMKEKVSDAFIYFFFFTVHLLLQILLQLCYSWSDSICISTMRSRLVSNVR